MARRRLLDRTYYLRRARSTVWRRGLGGSRAWLGVGAAWTGVRFLRKFTNPEPEVVYRHRLEPGERFEIVGSGGSMANPAGRRARRRDRRRSTRDSLRAGRSRRD